MHKIHVGVDVGKSFHYIWALDENRNCIYKGQVAQDETAIKEALLSCGDTSDMLVVVDQPNNIGRLVVMCARSLGAEVAFIPSKSMRAEAERQGKTSKTDRMDAEAIAVATFEAPALIHPIGNDETRAKIKVLRSRDKDLSHDLTRNINRLRAALLDDMPAFEAACSGNRIACGYILEVLVEFGGPWGCKAHLRKLENFTKKFSAKVPEGLIPAIFDALGAQTLAPQGLEVLEQSVIPALAKDIMRIQAERKELDAQVARLLEDDRVYQALLSVPGIGEKTAGTLAADIDIDAFDDVSSFTRYCGAAPSVSRSGTSIARNFKAKDGNKRIKDAMFISAFAAVQHDMLASEYYWKKRREGKTHAAAILALMRKRCKVIFAIMKSKEPYQQRISSIA